MPIHHLHEPIDVFSEWLDDCEAAERGEVAAASAGAAAAGSGGGNMSRVVHDTSQDYDDDDEDDDLPPPSGLTKKAAGAGGEGKTGGTLGLDDSDDDSSWRGVGWRGKGGIETKMYLIRGGEEATKDRGRWWWRRERFVVERDGKGIYLLHFAIWNYYQHT
jgi:hypothetical protein